jgi:hypothetical protein
MWQKEFRVTQPFLRITKKMRLVQQKEYEGSKGSKRKEKKLSPDPNNNTGKLK